MYRYKWHKEYDLQCNKYKIECFATFKEWKCFYEADPEQWFFSQMIDGCGKIYGIIPYYQDNHYYRYYTKFTSAKDYRQFQKLYKQIQKNEQINQEKKDVEQNLKNLSALAEVINNKLQKNLKNEDISEKKIYNAIKKEVEKNGWCIR